MEKRNNIKKKSSRLSVPVGVESWVSFFPRRDSPVVVYRTNSTCSLYRFHGQGIHLSRPIDYRVGAEIAFDPENLLRKRKGKKVGTSRAKIELTITSIMFLSIYERDGPSHDLNCKFQSPTRGSLVNKAVPVPYMK